MPIENRTEHVGNHDTQDWQGWEGVFMKSRSDEGTIMTKLYYLHSVLAA